jgi:hypothetical protein
MARESLQQSQGVNVKQLMSMEADVCDELEIPARARGERSESTMVMARVGWRKK